MFLSFHPIQTIHLPLIHGWFRTPHIQQWYASHKEWSMEEIEQKYHPFRLKKRCIQGYVIAINKKSIGYIQSYPIKDYPWEGLDLSSLPEKLAGIDFYIGEANYLQKGYGTQALTQFLKHYIDPHYEGSIVDPRQDNMPAIRCYEKVGFSFYQVILCQRESLQLMKRMRNLTSKKNLLEK